MAFQHDAHLLVYAALFLARFQEAYTAASYVALLSDKASVLAYPDFMESYVPTPIHVLIRFGKWKEILSLPFPEDLELYCSTTATLHYARGLAHAALGDTKSARACQQEFRAARTRIPASRMHFQVKVDDQMAIAEQMLEGEISYREGKHEEAYARLRMAVKLDGEKRAART